MIMGLTRNGEFLREIGGVSVSIMSGEKARSVQGHDWVKMKMNNHQIEYFASPKL